MPYDLQTPFGTIPGQVSPYEQLQAQTAARMRAQAAADDASSAQMHVLKQAMGGGSKPGDEPDFSFATGPKDTGAVDMSARNAAVMQRQMGQADKDADAFRSTGLDAGTRERLAQGAAMGLKGQQEEDDLLHGLIMQQYQKALGVAPKGDGIVSISGGREGAPKVYGDPDMMAPMGNGGGGGSITNPNFSSGGIDLGAMGGGSAPAGAGGASPGIDYRQLGALAALRNHTAMPDFAGQDEDRAYNRQRRGLDLKQREADLADTLVRRGKARATEDALESDPAAVAAKYPEVTAPLAKMAADFVAQDTKMVGWDPTDIDLDNMERERDRAAKALHLRGVPLAQAKEEANRTIITSLGANRNDLNSGWTKRLLARLQGGAEAAPANNGDIDVNAMNYGPGL